MHEDTCGLILERIALIENLCIMKNNEHSRSHQVGYSEGFRLGYQEGLKQAKIEQDAANFAAMNAATTKKSRGKQAMSQMMMSQRGSGFMGFDGNPNSMSFSSDPTGFKGSPNSMLNNF